MDEHGGPGDGWHDGVATSAGHVHELVSRTGEDGEGRGLRFVADAANVDVVGPGEAGVRVERLGAQMVDLVGQAVLAEHAACVTCRHLLEGAPDVLEGGGLRGAEGAVRRAEPAASDPRAPDVLRVAGPRIGLAGGAGGELYRLSFAFAIALDA